MSNVVRLPRPSGKRDGANELGFYLRVGRNDHKKLLDALATGHKRVFGLIIEAHNVDRHKELCTEARNRGFDVILDPMTQQMAMPGGHTTLLSELPWGTDEVQRVTHYTDANLHEQAEKIRDFVFKHKFTSVIGPTHYLQNPNDLWLRTDINLMSALRNKLDENGQHIPLIYSLAFPISVFREPLERNALRNAIADAPMDALWLKVDNFGSDTTGDKTKAYIEACQDLHDLGVPIIADRVGGLPGLGLLAFGAVGGISHGVTLLENFSAGGWKKPRTGRGMIHQPRVYVPDLDLFLKPKEAEAFFNASRLKSRFGCKNTHCCPEGLKGMIGNPVQHFLFQRSQQIDSIGNTPQPLRINEYLDRHVRHVSDQVAAAASFSGLDEDLQKKLGKKQQSVARFRDALVNLNQEKSLKDTLSVLPERRRKEENN